MKRDPLAAPANQDLPGGAGKFTPAMRANFVALNFRVFPSELPEAPQRWRRAEVTAAGGLYWRC